LTMYVYASDQLLDRRTQPIHVRSTDRPAYSICTRYRCPTMIDCVVFECLRPLVIRDSHVAWLWAAFGNRRSFRRFLLKPIRGFARRGRARRVASDGSSRRDQSATTCCDDDAGEGFDSDAPPRKKREVSITATTKPAPKRHSSSAVLCSNCSKSAKDRGGGGGGAAVAVAVGGAAGCGSSGRCGRVDVSQRCCGGAGTVRSGERGARGR